MIADHVVGLQFNDTTAVKCTNYRYRVKARVAGGAFGSTSDNDIGWRGTCAAALLRSAGSVPDQANQTMSQRAADLNGDGRVDVSDMLLVLSAFGACGDCPADLNGDGEVDVADLNLLLSDWG